MTKRRRRKKIWVYQPPKPPKPKVPKEYKEFVKVKADELIETSLKPLYIKPPPKNTTFNYLVDLYSKWWRNYFYFCSTYNCPGPNALFPSFESRFARLEFLEEDRFNLSYMRHTGQWWGIYRDLTLDECFDKIKAGVHFHP